MAVELHEAVVVGLRCLRPDSITCSGPGKLRRGIVEVHDRTGVVRLRSRAFGEFIKDEIDHGELDAWRKEGGGGIWQSLWPPLTIAAVLGLALLAMANPEMRTTLLAGLLGLLPAALPLFRGGQSSGATGSSWR